MVNPKLDPIERPKTARVEPTKDKVTAPTAKVETPKDKAAPKTNGTASTASVPKTGLKAPSGIKSTDPPKPATPVAVAADAPKIESDKKEETKSEPKKIDKPRPSTAQVTPS